MSRIFFDELEIPEPDYHLNVGSDSHSYQTKETLRKIEEVLIEEKPDLVIVFGDTNSTPPGASAATKQLIKMDHVEAGLRSCDKRTPEEANRTLTDHCSDLLFCPTRTSVKKLEKLGKEIGTEYMSSETQPQSIQ